MYMQLMSSYFRPPGLKAREFEYPAYSPLEFIRVMQVRNYKLICVGVNRINGLSCGMGS